MIKHLKNIRLATKRARISNRWLIYKSGLGELNKKYRLLIDVSMGFFKCNDRKSLANTLISKLNERMGLDKAYLLLRKTPEEPMMLVAHRGKRIKEEIIRQVTYKGGGLTGKALMRKKPIISNDVTKNLDYLNADRNTLSEMVIPIICGTTTWGALIIDSYAKNAFNKIDQELASILCSYFASALTRLYQYENLQHKSNMERLLSEIVTEAAKENDIKAICERVVRDLSQKTNFPWIDVWEVVDEKSGKTRLLYRHESTPADLIAQVESGIGLVGKTVRSRKTLYFPDVKSTPGNISLNSICSSELNVPIIFNDRIFGVLSLGSPLTNAFKKEDIEIIEILAKHLGVLWAYQDLLGQTTLQALKDPLTGLWNRRYFSEMLSKEISRCNRYGGIFSIAIMDLRGFKNINDIFGHLEGDKILVGVGNFLKKQLRSSDVLVRYGGDEFIAILPETGKNEALKLWRRIKKDIADNYWGKCKTTVDIDFGIASFPEDSDNHEELIKLADDWLYVNKKAAKNMA